MMKQAIQTKARGGNDAPDKKVIELKDKKHKRGLLDCLDTHACDGIKHEPLDCIRIRSTGSKDGIPYAPSLQSIPGSTSSEENVSIKNVNLPNNSQIGTEKVDKKDDFDNDTINECNTKMLKAEASIRQDNDEYMEKPTLDDNTGSNLSRNVPSVIDKRTSSSVSETKTTIESLQSNPMFLNFLMEAQKLYSVLGNEQEFSLKHIENEKLKIITNKIKSVTLRKTKKHKKRVVFYNAEGYPLTDSTGVPLVNDKGKSLLIVSENGELKDLYGRSVFTSDNKTHPEKPVLLLYDCNNYPLTDNQGNILTNATYQDLVLFKNRKPHHDCFNRIIFDINGEPSESPNFKPFAIPKKNVVISKIQLFDFRGYPLSDTKGACLMTLDGKNLVSTDETGAILCDINNHPIFDRSGIPLTKQSGCWLTPKGIPYRVFTKFKFPLTNKYGRSIVDLRGIELLKCDEYGRPLFDINDKPVYDAIGNLSATSEFSPSTSPRSNNSLFFVCLDSEPLTVFNKKGQPLTEPDGEVLSDSDGQNLIELNSNYCENNLHINNIPSNAPVIKLKVYPHHSYNEIARFIIKEVCLFRLKHRTTQHDFICEPLKDRNENFVFDSKGNQLFFHKQQIFSEIDVEFSIRKEKCLEQIDSPKSTDTDSNCDVSDETNTIKATSLEELGNSSTEHLIDFHTETDIFGRPLYDFDNQPLFDKYGRPMYDLFCRALFDSEGRPVATAYGKRLVDGLDKVNGHPIDFETSLLVSQNPNNLPSCRDLNGGPLFDFSGFPLYNVNGKPLIDAYGRPMYDENGFPLSDNRGLPTSVIVINKLKEISNVEDVFKLFYLSPMKIHNTESKRLVIQDASISSDVLKQFIGRIRITTFLDGDKCFEVLEAVPFPEN